jgi:two-component system, OmpR family, sensor kinase
VVLPLVVGALAWLGWWSGTIPGGRRRAELAVSALPADWALAACVAGAGVAAAVLAIRDRSRRARDRTVARAELAAAQHAARDRQLLMGRLDHELKNPLTAIRLAVANVAAGDDGHAQRAGLRSIDEQVVRLSRLTADLRKIADIETGPLDRGPVDLGALLRDAVETAGDQPRAAGRHLSLALPRAPWPLPAVEGDGDLLALALVNLVDNAVKYTPDGGTVEVRARESPDGVLVEVADTGQGIAADDLPHIWDELFRGRTARGTPGSGLGLSLVRAVVERHSGSVGAESREGEGTVVRVVLPVAPVPRR